MRRHCSERGYALLLTLVLLAVAATALSGVSLVAYRRAIEVQQSAEELQARWGALSCRATFLPRAPEFLTRHEQQRRQPQVEFRATVPLGAQTFDLHIADEQAKANLDVVHRIASGLQAERAVRRLVGMRTLEVVLTSNRYAKDNSPSVRAFSSPGQVFRRALPSELAGEGARPGAMARITLWGDGKTNYRRASRQVLSEICAPELGDYEVGRLLDLRSRSPAPTLSQALSELGLSEKPRNACVERLTDASNCYSLWIICSSSRRKWYKLFVAEDATVATATVWAFEW